MAEPIYLGIEGGGTRTVAVATKNNLEVLYRLEFGPGNLRLLDDKSLKRLFRTIARTMPDPVAVGVGLAGLRDASDHQRVQTAAESCWGGVPIAIANDLEIALHAANLPKEGARVLLLSGTGSCCFGRTDRGKTAKVGGWGHLLGDLGSGYDIAMRALRGVIYEYDRFQRWGGLGR